MKKNLYLHFSPLQKKCGLVVFKHNELTLNLIVLPKVWQPKYRSNPWPKEWSTRSLCITAYEGERHHLVNVSPGWIDALTACAQSIEKHTTISPEDTSFIDDIATLEHMSGLFSIVTGFRQDKTQQWGHSDNTDDYSTHLRALFYLGLRCNKLVLHDLAVSKSNFLEGISLDKGLHHSELYQLILTYEFLNEIEQHWLKIHQDYVSMIERRSSIRGSITGRSLMELDVGISLQPVCRYDRFVPNTPIQQVLVSTLDIVHQGYTLSGLPLLQNSPIGQSIRQKAQALRTKLSFITSLPIENARNTSRFLILKASEQHWTNAIRIAKLLLNIDPIDLYGNQEGVGGKMWCLNTDKIWEQILEMMLVDIPTSVEFDPQSKKSEIPKPWAQLGDQLKPDFIHRFPDHTLVLDAKYKVNWNKCHVQAKVQSNAPVNISRDDQAQMYIYSQMVASQKWVTNAILYPAPIMDNAEDIVEGRCYFQQHSNKQRDYSKSLRSFSIPFPSHQTVLDESAWNTFIHKVQKAIEPYFLNQVSVIDLSPNEQVLDAVQKKKDFGEVFTPNWIVNDMIAMLPEHIKTITARYLEPSAGDGAFLVPLLQLKLDLVFAEYDDLIDRIQHALTGLYNLYGVEIQLDNVQMCRLNLHTCFMTRFEREQLPFTWYERLHNCVAYIVEHNIIHGDLLTGKRPEVDKNGVALSKDKGDFIYSIEKVRISEWNLDFATGQITQLEFSLKEELDFLKNQIGGLFADSEPERPIHKNEVIQHYLQIT